MCSEREPLDCHRCLLVGRALAERGCTIGHILGDGSVEPHSATEERLIAGLESGDDLFGDRPSRLADAYRKRAANRRPVVRPGPAGANPQRLCVIVLKQPERHNLSCGSAGKGLAAAPGRSEIPAALDL